MASEPVILLAGGKSSRMGEPKGLVRVGGRPWLEVQLESLARAGMTEVIVVLGYRADEYLGALPWLREALDPKDTESFGARVCAVINPLPEYGPFSTIQAGTRRIAADASSAWILPVDVPCAGPEAMALLRASGAPASVPTYQGRGGHPVRLSAGILRRLELLPPDHPDSRLDVQLRALGSQVDRIEVPDSRVVANFNTPDQWPRD